MLAANVRAQLVQKEVTREGETIFLHQQEVKVGTQFDGEEDRLLLLWPLIIGHK